MTNERDNRMILVVVALIFALGFLWFAADFLSPVGPHGVGMEVQDK